MIAGTLLQLFGKGYLDRAPINTFIDMVNGTLDIPQTGAPPARFVRAPHSRLWVAIDEDAAAAVRVN